MKALAALIGAVFLALGSGEASARPCADEGRGPGAALAAAAFAVQGSALAPEGSGCDTFGPHHHASSDLALVRAAGPAPRGPSKTPAHPFALERTPGPVLARASGGPRAHSPLRHRARGGGDLLLVTSRRLL